MNGVARGALLAIAAAGALAPRAAAAGPSGCPGPTLGSDAPPPASTPWRDASLSPDARTDLLLGAMTLEEKVDLATGERCYVYGYYNAPIDRLGIPALTMTDGPAGVRIPYERVNHGRATQLPAPIALAASWDVGLARVQGDVLGGEAFATGHNVLLGPTLDVARSPLAGRGFEGLGEDPLLAARFAGPLVEGIQGHPVLADAKHFAVYTQETDRFTIDVELDERALRDVYLPPFEAAIRAGVASVMCGFNRVNGTFSCENPLLLGDLLKGELGFQGFVLSDWASIHGTVGAALAGLDQELAFERYFGRKLRDAVRAGDVPEAVVDDKARRILRGMFRLGLFDHRAEVRPLPERENGARSREIGEQGVVLLRNEGGLLPLAPDGARSIAVIGPDAANASAQGGGAARVEPTYAVSPLDGIRARAGAGVRVEHAAGGDPVNAAYLLPGPPPVPSSVLAPPSAGGAHGLRAEYWTNATFRGAPDLVRVDRQVALSAGFFNYQSVNAASVPQLPLRYSLTKFSARWTGTITAPAAGDHVLTLTSRGRGWVWLDGALVIDHSEPHDLSSRSVTVPLLAGESHALRVDYAADHEDVGKKTDIGGDVKLGWEPPPGTVPPAVREAAELAARSELAVVVARDYETEERDRLSLALPGDQDALIRAVSAANPRTVVVLTTGQPVTMPWLADVPAVLEAWYAGQEQGNAIARVLFGDVNPSGKLPVTFPRALDQTPTGDGALSGGDADGRIRFGEGVLVGYRWYDATGVEPLFPFGFGLSYTEFAYDDGPAVAHVAAPAGAGAPAGATTVEFTVRNTGARAGAEVAQLYLGPCPHDRTTPPRQLAGFAKVTLAPNERARVSVELAPEVLAPWDPGIHARRAPACERPLYVGSSSRDVRLVGRLAASGKALAGSGSGGCASGEAGGVCAAGLAAAWLLVRRRRRRAVKP